MSISIIFATILFHIIFPLKAYNIVNYFLYNPAIGEGQASINFKKIFYIALPIILITSTAMSHIFIHFIRIIFQQKYETKAKFCLLVLLFNICFGISFKVFFLEELSGPIFVFLVPIILIFYFTIYKVFFILVFYLRIIVVQLIK